MHNQKLTGCPFTSQFQYNDDYYIRTEDDLKILKTL